MITTQTPPSLYHCTLLVMTSTQRSTSALHGIFCHISMKRERNCQETKTRRTPRRHAALSSGPNIHKKPHLRLGLSLPDECHTGVGDQREYLNIPELGLNFVIGCAVRDL